MSSEDRVKLLNGRLTWTLDYLNCLSTFVEQKHSARLEMVIRFTASPFHFVPIDSCAPPQIIIVLIFLELLVALRIEYGKFG